MRKELEDKAYEQYGILKVDDDLYLDLDAYFITGSLDLKVFLESKLHIKIEELLEAEVIDSINNIIDLLKQTVNIFLVEEGEDDIHTFEIINVINNKSFLLSSDIINDSNSREMLTGIVAGAYLWWFRRNNILRFKEIKTFFFFNTYCKIYYI